MTLPRHLAPMLATAGALPTDDDAWAYEVKWDGVRVLAAVEGGTVRLTSRNGNEVTGAYPELRGLATALDGPALLDGEVVALDGRGRSDFGLLQSRMHVRGPDPALVRATPVTFVAFDLLHDTGSLLDQPYDARRARLEQLPLTGQSFQLSPSFRGDGAAVVQVTRAQGLEGVVAKRRDSLYQPGRRSDSWRKIKHLKRQSAVVGGWKPGEGGRSGRIGSLLLGVQSPDGLVFAGHVGTGFTQAELARLGALLAPLRRAGSPFAAEVPREHARHAVWVEPVLVAEIELTAWTREGRLRHPSYKGLRDDLDPGQVVRE
ncbi:MAG: polymerase LigD, ligase domain protein [Frankiales bacterium]|nr:polymerase LigD, ligase domain protein [Frankiales bacterium]